MPIDGSSAEEDGCRRPSSRRSTDNTLLSDPYGPRAIDDDSDRHVVMTTRNLSARILGTEGSFYVMLYIIYGAIERELAGHVTNTLPQTLQVFFPKCHLTISATHRQDVTRQTPRYPPNDIREFSFDSWRAGIRRRGHCRDGWVKSCFDPW